MQRDVRLEPLCSTTCCESRWTLAKCVSKYLGVSGDSLCGAATTGSSGRGGMKESSRCKLQELGSRMRNRDSLASVGGVRLVLACKNRQQTFAPSEDLSR